MAAQDRNRAPQNPATAPIKPRWSAIGSPEADDRRAPASPDRHTKTTPPRARQTPASLPPGAIPPIKESRRCPKRYGFFNSLLVDYFLFFATNNLRGLEKMKEAMWRVDPTGGFSFSDATDPNQSVLFAPEPDRQSLRTMIQHQFASRSASVQEIERFVIEQTPFLPTHYKRVLAAMEAENAVSPVNPPAKRRRGTYGDGAMRLRFR